MSPNLEEVKSVIDKMILYHSVLVSDIDNEPEFGDYTYGFYPYEILFLMHIRRKLGLPVPDKFEDLLRERERQNPKFTFLFDASVCLTISLILDSHVHWVHVDTRKQVVSLDNSRRFSCSRF